jgi:hypothetical protein
MRSFGDARALADLHAELLRATHHVRGVGARHHRLGWNAAGVDAGAAEELPLDDRHRHAGAREPAREIRARLPGADDDGVVGMAHRSAPEEG